MTNKELSDIRRYGSNEQQIEVFHNLENRINAAKYNAADLGKSEFRMEMSLEEANFIMWALREIRETLIRLSYRGKP